MGEKFITEARMYHEMDKEYKLSILNEFNRKTENFSFLFIV